MKKILTLFGGLNLVSLSIVGTMNTTSCIWPQKNVVAPQEPISDFFKIHDLGDISGETELPTTELIIELLWVKNGYSLESELYEDEHYSFHDSVEFIEGPTLTGCIIKPTWRTAISVTGTLEIKYNYSINKSFSRNLLQANELTSRSTWGGSVESVIEGEVSNVELKNFTTLANNYDFFTRLNSYKSLGYDVGDNGEGLCEYIALTSYFNYFQLYGKNKNYYSDSEIKNDYWNYSKNNIDHKNYNNKGSVPYKMWKKTGKKTNIISGKTMENVANSWLGENNTSKYNLKTTTSYMHSSQPENWIKDYGVPVILTFAKINGEGHSVIIYGYNKKTNQYAVNFGWPNYQNRDYSRILVNKSNVWSYFSMGFLFQLREK